MGRKKLFTEQVKDFIKANSETMSPLEMAEQLPVGERSIINYMKSHLNRRTRTTSRRMFGVKEGCFNVMERDNWLV